MPPEKRIYTTENILRNGRSICPEVRTKDEYLKLRWELVEDVTLTFCVDCKADITGLDCPHSHGDVPRCCICHDKVDPV